MGVGIRQTDAVQRSRDTGFGHGLGYGRAEAAERALRGGAERLEAQMAENLELPEDLRRRLDEEHTHIRALQVRAREQGLEYSRRRIREDVNLNSRGRADELRRTRARRQES